jgi:hypothetical protein
MIEQEYYRVGEIGKMNNMTSRNIRKIISKLIDDTTESLLHKDNNGLWKVHHLLLPNFKRKRAEIKKQLAISIDPVCFYSEKEIIARLNQFILKLDDDDLEFNIVIEQKLKDGRNHIHGYYYTKKKREFITGLKFWLPGMSYHNSKMYDKEGWLSYITKDGNKIITIK